MRFETEPGERLQLDLTHIRRGQLPLLAFVATLGDSRASLVRFTERADAATMVIERDECGAGQHRFHLQLLQIAEQYDFVPRLCRPYRATTKGKIEQFNRYLKESTVLPLATTLNQAGIILDAETANAHVGL